MIGNPDLCKDVANVWIALVTNRFDRRTRKTGHSTFCTFLVLLTFEPRAHRWGASLEFWEAMVEKTTH